MLPKVLVPTKSYGLPSSVAPSPERVTGEDWPRAAIAAHHRQRVALVEVEVEASCALTGPMFFSGTATVSVADLQRLARVVLGEAVLEAELERQVFLRVAVAVDVDLVHGRRIEREVVRAAVRILQRQVVGDQRDVSARPASYELNR